MDNTVKDINKAISNQPTHIENQQMTLHQLKKLLKQQNNNEQEEIKKVKVGKLSVVDTQYLQKLLEKYGNQYQKWQKMLDQIKCNEQYLKQKKTQSIHLNSKQQLKYDY